MKFLLTKFMYPLEEKLEIMDGYYFDNPRTPEEIKYVKRLIQKSTPFPPNDSKAGGEGFVTLNYIIDRLKFRYDDPYVTEYIENICKYKDAYYKVASMWVILRLKDNTNLSEYENIIEIAKKYIDMLTLLSFDVYNYVDFSVLVSNELYDFNEERLVQKIQNSLIEVTVETTRRKEQLIKKEEYRFNGFMFYYNNIIETYRLIKDFNDKETINYITECIQCLRMNYDLKMKFVTIVSIIELLLTHSPDFSRFNVEDSISKQFTNKVTLILYLNDRSVEYKDLMKECKLMYSIRSNIAHGGFQSLNENLIKYFNFCREIECISIEEYDSIYVWEKLINRTLKYMTIVFKEYLNDYKLLDIIKKI